MKLRKFIQYYVRGSFSSWSPAPSGVPQGSVLGPILFNIFINDLPPCLKYSFCVLFADDLKIYRIVQSVGDHDLLQSDLNSIAQWASNNRISFNISKSSVIHLGANSFKLPYFLNGAKLSPKDTIRDLGILVDYKLNFHNQCAAAAKKATSTAHYILKSFSFLNPYLFTKLFKTFIRPHLEYCIQVWRPHCKKSIELLEKTQRKITKWCPGLRNIPYATRLQVLKLSTLEARFNRGDLIETYKLLTNHYNMPYSLFFTHSHNTITRGHSLKLNYPKFRTNIRKYFFSYRVVTPWNNLPEPIISSSSTNQWKSRYDAMYRVR